MCQSGLSQVLRQHGQHRQQSQEQRRHNLRCPDRPGLTEEAIGVRALEPRIPGVPGRRSPVNRDHSARHGSDPLPRINVTYSAPIGNESANHQSLET